MKPSRTTCVFLNCSNDAFDAETGADIKKAESVVNLTGNRAGVLALANAFLLGGAGLLAKLVLKVNTQLVTILIILSCLT